MSKRSHTLPGKVYQFVHREDLYIRTNLAGRRFDNQWLRIQPEGTITLKGSSRDGYAWDGCSPKGQWLHVIWGTPDGKLDYRTEQPMTYFASMFHDVMYQFKDEIDLSRWEADELFKQVLQQSGFLLWPLYWRAVRLFGGQFGGWQRQESQQSLRLLEMSWLDG